jgi:glucose-6-phosphate-specific signal transduction histidine kinase
MKSVWRTSESDPARPLRPAPSPKRQRRSKTTPREESRQRLYAHEEERRRLSLALHDSMTQSLAALSTNVDLIERSASVLSPRTRAIVAETRFIARQCFQQVRRLTDHLYPPLVAEVGLPLALRCTVANFAERTGVRIACQSDDCPRLPLEIEIALFRVVEDCLSTFHQVARGNASVSLAISHGAVELAIHPVMLDTVARWRRHFALQFGGVADVRVAALPSPQRLSGPGEPGVGLVVTVPAVVVERDER